jgi:molecular chaperone DnaK
LGTTESVLAYIDDSGAVHTWKPAGGSALHASAVLVGDDIVVGDEAVRNADASSTLIECFKRDMGKSHCSKTVNEIKVPPEILSGFVLQHLRNRAEEDIGTITDVVISVPAYFDAKRRQTTQEAGRLAGMNVVAIINEPTAAAIGYSYHQGLLDSSKTTSEQTLLVYDFGGGTFDVTLLRFTEDRFVTLATDGDVRLGGFDIDERLANFLAEAFVKEKKLDPRSTQVGIKDLMAVANETKHILTSENEHVAPVVFNGQRANIRVTRRQFDELIGPFIERTLTTCEDVLYAAGNVKWDQIHSVLLVGGSSQIPYISDKLESLTGNRPQKIGNPQELVAEGCALYAANLSKHHQLNFDIANVNSHSLGIRGRDIETGQPMNRILVPRNTTLPKTVQKKFVTFKDGQRSVRLILLEGESENPDLCYEVGKFRVELGPGVIKGEVIHVFCNYNTDGTIHVSAELTRNNRSGTLEIQRNSTSLESLEIWRNRLINGGELSHSDSEFFGSLDAIIDGEPKSSFEELAELDSEFKRVGKSAKAIALPAGLIREQRFTNDLETQINRLQELIERIRIEISATTDPQKRQELKDSLGQIQQIELQKQKSYEHSVMVLGRACYMNRLPSNVLDIPMDKIGQLVKQVEQIWHAQA